MAKRNLPEHVLFDVRLVQRHIEEGLITQADVDAYRSKCDDAAENQGVIAMNQLFKAPQ